MRQPPRVRGGSTPEIENFDPETAALTAGRQQQKAARAYELPDVSEESHSLVDGKIIDVVEQRRYVEQLLGPSLPDIGRLDSTPVLQTPSIEMPARQFGDVALKLQSQRRERWIYRSGVLDVNGGST